MREFHFKQRKVTWTGEVTEGAKYVFNCYVLQICGFNWFYPNSILKFYKGLFLLWKSFSINQFSIIKFQRGSYDLNV